MVQPGPGSRASSAALRAGSKALVYRSGSFAGRIPSFAVGSERETFTLVFRGFGQFRSVAAESIGPSTLATPLPDSLVRAQNDRVAIGRNVAGGNECTVLSIGANGQGCL